jgi:hypothetical protein
LRGGSRLQREAKSRREYCLFVCLFVWGLHFTLWVSTTHTLHIAPSRLFFLNHLYNTQCVGEGRDRVFSLHLPLPNSSFYDDKTESHKLSSWLCFVVAHFIPQHQTDENRVYELQLHTLHQTISIRQYHSPTQLDRKFPISTTIASKLHDWTKALYPTRDMVNNIWVRHLFFLPLELS